MWKSELATASEGKRDQVLALLRELENAGQIRPTGQRRATRWHLITDEERIAARQPKSPHQASDARRTPSDLTVASPTKARHERRIGS